MTATIGEPAVRLPDLRLRDRRVATAALLGGGSVLLGGAAARQPVLVTGGVLGLVVAALIARHLLVAVSLLVGSFFFDAYLDAGGVLTAGKAIGAIALLAWLIDGLIRGRSMRPAPLLWPVAAFAAVLVPSLAVVVDIELGLVFATRYLMFFALVFLVIQAVDGQYPRARTIVDVAIWAAAGAAVIGLIAFIIGSADRAGGPIRDPNDFAFVLSSVVPLALWRRKWTTARVLGRNPYTLATIVIVGTILATLSRGAFVALAVAGVWAVSTRRLPLRQGIAAVVLVGVVAAAGFVLNPDVVDEAVQRKSVVAQNNVDSRVEAWEVAILEFKSSPLTGVGPGQFRERYTDFAPAPDETGGLVITTHNAYLNVLAELGLPGLVAFLAYLFVAWRGLRRREADVEIDEFRGALAAGFVIAVVGAFFLTEQFFAPIWLLGSLGAGHLALSSRTNSRYRAATASRA